jgi:outer membrane receptor protein involved in Fe transport
MRKGFIKFVPILMLPFSPNAFAIEQEETVVVASSTDSVLTLDSMAVSADVTDAKVGGIDVKTLPFASTIINQDEIKRLKYVAPDELLDRIPGESQVRNLRIPNGSKSYTIPLVDGAALTSPLRGSTQTFSDSVNSQDIERIEIFKGPTSALFPNNSFGGVINIVSKGSTHLPEQNTRFWAEAGMFNRYRGGASTQGELKDVGYLFDYSGWNLDHYRDEGELTTGRIFETGEERQQASAKFIFHPDDASSLVVRGSYLKDHLADPGDIFENDFNIDDEGIGRDTGFFSDAETFLGSAIYKRDFTDADHLEANFTFIYLDTSGFSRFNGANEDIAINVNGKVSYKHDFDFWDTNFIVGTDIFQGIEDDFNPARTSRDRVVPGNFDYATTDIYAGFAQLQFSPIENLQITAGVRHESIDLNHTNTSLAGDNTRNNASFSATLPKVGISYDFLDAHRLWFAYGEGFLVPTTGQLYTGRGNNPNLNPEEAEHFEVGLRGSFPLFERELTYDISYYYQDINQYIVLNDLNGIDENTNAGKVNIQGVETTAKRF